MSHLNGRFGDDFPLEGFLSITGARARCEYGQDFAQRHATLCDSLRRALAQKFLCDRRAEREDRAPGDLRNRIRNRIACEPSELSVGELRGEPEPRRRGKHSRGLSSPRYAAAAGRVRTPQRVSVKDRLGFGAVAADGEGVRGRLSLGGRLAPRGGERTPVDVGRDRGRGGEGGFLTPTGQSIIPIKVLVQLRKRKRRKGPFASGQRRMTNIRRRLFC